MNVHSYYQQTNIVQKNGHMGERNSTSGSRAPFEELENANTRPSQNGGLKREPDNANIENIAPYSNQAAHVVIPPVSLDTAPTTEQQYPHSSSSFARYSHHMDIQNTSADMDIDLDGLEEDGDEAEEDQEMYEGAPISQQTTAGDMDCGVEIIEYNSSEEARLKQDIIEKLFYFERRRIYRCNPNYLEVTQSEITPGMRAMLVDWLVDVALEYQLLPQTVFLAVNYIDRYLSKVNIARDVLQLVGITCMLIAAKFEEISAPLIEDFVYITDNTYTADMIRRVEKNILGTLEFHLMATTPRAFLSAFTSYTDMSVEQTTFIEFLMERLMQEVDYLRFAPSEICAASVAYSNAIFQKPIWPDTAMETSGLSKEDIKECFYCLQVIHLRSPTSRLTAVMDKYSTDKMYRVAQYVPSQQ